MMNDLIAAIGAWLGKAGSPGDSAGIALSVMRIRAAQRLQTGANDPHAATPPVLAAAA
jgi:hypothetical protein